MTRRRGVSQQPVPGQPQAEGSPLPAAGHSVPGGTIMAGPHRDETPETGRPDGQRAAVSRRAMLRTAAGAGAAGLVTGGVLAAGRPAAAAARPGRSRPPAGRPVPPAATAATADRATGPLVIHVRDADTGEMDIFAGTTRTRLRDPALAARLVRTSR